MKKIWLFICWISLIALAWCTFNWKSNLSFWSGTVINIENETTSAFSFSKIFEVESENFIRWVGETEDFYDEIVHAPTTVKSIAKKMNSFWLSAEYPTDSDIIFSAKKDFWNDKYMITAYEDSYILEKNGEQILEFPREFILTEPLKNFVVNEEWWWLLYYQIHYYSDEEVDTIFDQTWKYPEKPRIEIPILVHNWKELRYNEIFGLHTFWGKIFYFFREKVESPIQYFYNWKVYKTEFKDIIHNVCGCDEEEGLDIKADEENGKLILWEKNRENLELWLMEITR